MQTNSLPPTGFIRLERIVGNPKRCIPAIYPVSKSTWWQWVKEGKAPKPIKLSHGVTVWRIEDILALIAEGGRS
jgi:hypothetical protein